MLLQRFLFTVIIMFSGMVAFEKAKTTATSPDKNSKLNFWLNDKGVPLYSVSYKNNEMLLPSVMGFELKQTLSNEALPAL